MSIETYAKYWAENYKEDLTHNIMPFWLKNGLDKEHGGIYTCVARNGQLIDTTKSVWFQGRFAFICSYAYNNIEKNPEWLDAAKLTLDFIEKHCFDTDGRMYFEVAADGTPLRKRRYVFSESFAAIAMSEYALATGNKKYAQKALDLFKRMRHFLNTPGILEPKYLPTVQAQGHSITMIMVNVASSIKKVISDPELDAQIEESIYALKNYFMHPEFKALLEMVGPKGEFIDTMNGRTINPGHCIETSWFLFDVARNMNDNKELIDMALTILDWSWENCLSACFNGSERSTLHSRRTFLDCRLPHRKISLFSRRYPHDRFVHRTSYRRIRSDCSRCFFLAHHFPLVRYHRNCLCRNSDVIFT